MKENFLGHPVKGRYSTDPARQIRAATPKQEPHLIPDSPKTLRVYLIYLIEESERLGDFGESHIP